MFRSAVLALLFSAVSLAGCGRRETIASAATTPNDPAALPAAVAPATAVALPSPAGKGSGEPNLTTAPDGRVVMSWLEGDRETKRFAVKVASFANGAWSPPRTVVERDDLFVNWADFPSVVVGHDGRLYAHWLQKSASDVYSYDVRIASSGDGGQTWSRSIIPHRDGTKTEHGFVSLSPLGGGGVAAVWLDGRNMKEEEGGHGQSGAMTIRYAEIDAAGALRNEAELDARVCECCQTGMTLTKSGAVVAYRDRSEDEIRDIGVATLRGGKWSEPRVVHDDGWKIEGCPVNGPQLDSRGDDVVVAWYSGAGGKGLANVSFSGDGGETFGKPIRVDDGQPVGRVDVLMLADGAAQVTWVERTGESAEVRSRRVSRDGTVGAAMSVAASTAARAAGFPRTTLAGDDIVFAWTEPSDPPIVRVAKARAGAKRGR